MIATSGIAWPWWTGIAAAFPWLIHPIAALLMVRPRPDVRDYPALPAGDSPLVSIIVPARNEAENVEHCVTSLLASAYPRFEVIAVDDRSMDGTVHVLQHLASRDARMRVIEGEELPRGWFGKPWACTQGARVANGSILLFTDADTVHGPDLLGHTVAMLAAEKADMVTLLPRQAMWTFWERVVQPHFFVMLGLRFGSAKGINRRQHPRDAIANGQFIMVTRSSYDEIGGHGAVKGQVVEDVMLARRYAEAGKKRWFAHASHDMATRMYHSLPEIVEGWSKNTFVGSQVANNVGSVGVYFVMLLLMLLPLAMLAGPAALIAGPLLDHWGLTLFGAAATVSDVIAFSLFLKSNDEPWWYGAFYWVGSLVQLWIFLLATMRGKKRIHWKGRIYEHG